MILIHAIPVVIVETDWPTFWVGVATAMSTFLAAAVAAALGVRAIRAERRRREENAATELNRRAELQAVLVSTEKINLVRGTKNIHRIRVLNRSDKPIMQIRAGIRYSGTISWNSVEMEQMNSGGENPFDSGAEGDFPPESEWTALAEFKDSYGRKWQIDGSLLTLVAAAEIRGTPELRQQIIKQFG